MATYKANSSRSRRRYCFLGFRVLKRESLMTSGQTAGQGLPQRRLAEITEKNSQSFDRGLSSPRVWLGWTIVPPRILLGQPNNNPRHNSMGGIDNCLRYTNSPPASPLYLIKVSCHFPRITKTWESVCHCNELALRVG